MQTVPVKPSGQGLNWVEPGAVVGQFSLLRHGVISKNN